MVEVKGAICLMFMNTKRVEFRLSVSPHLILLNESLEVVVIGNFDFS